MFIGSSLVQTYWKGVPVKRVSTQGKNKDNLEHAFYIISEESIPNFKQAVNVNLE